MAMVQMADRTVPLQGDLTLATAAGCYRKLNPMWGGSGGPVAIDLEKVGRVDSAGLALLLEWQARARSRGEPLVLRNPPARLLQLAALCEATELLGLEPGTEEHGTTQEAGS